MVKKLVAFLVILSFTSVIKSQNVISVDSLKKHVYTLADDSYEGRSIGTDGGDRASQYIVKQFKRVGIQPILSDYYHHFVYKTQAVAAEGKNIIGIIEGAHPQLKNEYIVIGAHYDHIGYFFENGEKIIYNGADDNASGVASIIELGRAIINNRDKFERSIVLVAFDGEESGLNGSQWMVKDNIVPLSQIKLMISIDMVGMLGTNKGVELLGIGTLKNGKLLAQQSTAKLDINITKATKSLQNSTDTKPFGDKGIPAIHVTTGTLSPYHKPEDDANLLDYEGMAVTNDFIYDFVLKTSSVDASELLSELPAAGKQSIFIPGVRLNLGSSTHNYPDNFYRGKKDFALQAGFYAHIYIINRISLQPELLYETMGSRHANGKYRSQAITAPVNLLVKFAGNNDFDTWSHILLGAYYTYNFGGKLGGTDIDYSNTFNAVEYGINVGFVINVSAIQLGIIRKIGLTNLYQDKSVGNMQNGAFMATLGMQF